MQQHNNGVHEITYPKDNDISQAYLDDGIKNLLEGVTNPLAAFERLRITDTTEIDSPVPIVTIYDSIICTEGNITTVSGAPKGGKTALIGILLAGAISKDGNVDGLEGLKVAPNIFGKAVIHFDTEQARHRQQSNTKTILKRAGYDTCPEYFRSYNIRELDLAEFFITTKNIAEAASQQFNGIHLMVVDGIADYIPDVNDQTQSNAIVKSFEELAIKYKVPVIVIVHTNPGTDKERGHLGSQCQRKSESVLIVKSENQISFVEPKFLRMAGKQNVPTIQFMYDPSKGYHVDCGIRSSQGVDKDAQRMAIVRQVCDEVFSGLSALSYGDAITAIAKVTNKGTTTVKQYFADMKTHDMIYQTPDKTWRLKSNQNSIEE
jgi:hypothetical protein